MNVTDLTTGTTLSLEEALKRTLPKDGDGGNNGGMEARIAKVEADVANIKDTMSEMKQDIRGLRSDARTDFRILFGALIAAALGLAGMMAKGFGWM